MIEPNSIEVQVVNWEKYNPRSKAKRLHWYRQENNIFDHHHFSALTVNQKLFYFYLMSLASLRQGRATLMPSRVYLHCKLKLSQLHKILSFFETIDFVEVISKTGAAVVHYITEHNRTEQNNTPNGVLEALPIGGGKKLGAAGVIAIEKHLERTSASLVADIVGAYREHAGETKFHEFSAQESLPEEAWHALIAKYKSWRSFCIEYAKEHQSGFGGRFERQLAKVIEGYLSRSLVAK